MEKVWSIHVRWLNQLCALHIRGEDITHNQYDFIYFYWSTFLLPTFICICLFILFSGYEPSNCKVSYRLIGWGRSHFYPLLLPIRDVRRISRFIDFKSELKEQILFGVALCLTLCWKQSVGELLASLFSLAARRLHWSGCCEFPSS